AGGVTAGRGRGPGVGGADPAAGAPGGGGAAADGGRVDDDDVDVALGEVVGAEEPGDARAHDDDAARRPPVGIPAVTSTSIRSPSTANSATIVGRAGPRAREDSADVRVQG